MPISYPVSRVLIADLMMITVWTENILVTQADRGHVYIVIVIILKLFVYVFENNILLIKTIDISVGD